MASMNVHQWSPFSYKHFTLHICVLCHQNCYYHTNFFVKMSQFSRMIIEIMKIQKLLPSFHIHSHELIFQLTKVSVITMSAIASDTVFMYL